MMNVLMPLAVMLELYVTIKKKCLHHVSNKTNMNVLMPLAVMVELYVTIKCLHHVSNKTNKSIRTSKCSMQV